MRSPVSPETSEGQHHDGSCTMLAACASHRGGPSPSDREPRMADSATNVVREPQLQEPQAHVGYPGLSGTLTGHAAPAESVDESTPTLDFPVDWLLDHATPPLQYRACVDVMRMRPDEGLCALPYASQTA